MTSNLHHLLDFIDITAWQERQVELSDAGAVSIYELLVEKSEITWRQGYLPQSEATRCFFLVAQKGHDHALQRIPHDQHWVVFRPTSIPECLGVEFRNSVQEQINRCTCCKQTVAKFNTLRADIDRNEHFAQMQGQTHHTRLYLKWVGDHVVLSIDDCAHMFHNCLREGFNIAFDINGSRRIMHSQPTSPED